MLFLVCSRSCKILCTVVRLVWNRAASDSAHTLSSSYKAIIAGLSPAITGGDVRARSGFGKPRCVGLAALKANAGKVLPAGVR